MNIIKVVLRSETLIAKHIFAFFIKNRPKYFFSDWFENLQIKSGTDGFLYLKIHMFIFFSDINDLQNGTFLIAILPM